ncbi:hypothetical protein BTA51_09835 [Hahella sp. CCB-MM4]|uniref:hypothetical protein n=1 Tax=Hahella sp. (strain CCB-MM4) TaxID=1926491 RepID=UPI000B9C526E|nr:hypothetical protein [Hahella sp. CCB-MM4]OZG74060.1 hypothetical protein BTA51_09835 [Hahella sp. CCB-MM4]
MDTIATKPTDKKGNKVAKDGVNQSILLKTAPPAATSPLKLSTEITEILTAALAQHVGPVATHLIHRVAAYSESLPEMISQLALYVPEGSERHSFIEQARMHCLKSITGHPARSDVPKSPSSPGTSTNSSLLSPPKRKPLPKYRGTVGTVLSEEKVQRLIQLLSTYVGPLAGHIVRSCMEESRTEIKLCMAMAKYISDENERTQFLNKVRLRSY